ncbi:hypothetical protein TWF569_000269 [Orbilia oligospora]|nr:hypothetical protein TWF103_011826 [Orbilia oligospora]KAF3116359.1 hypothetical protein TWF706_004007 [Orbilia oligospora]KAF3133563.1 hypothetical protein TWF594_009030 [Orbilia oligospora]KAF3154290.1 hypothetical protein TWF569_000269 [Orbilia oligospora]
MLGGWRDVMHITYTCISRSNTEILQTGKTCGRPSCTETYELSARTGRVCGWVPPLSSACVTRNPPALRAADFCAKLWNGKIKKEKRLDRWIHGAYIWGE